MRLVAVDPDSSTGVATWQDHLLDFYQLGPKEHHGELWNLLSAEWCRADTVICGLPTDRIGAEYIGVAKAFCDAFSVRLVVQGASIKQWATDIKLRRWGAQHTNWYLEQRAIDAQRHILYFLAHNVYVPDELRMSTLRRLKTSTQTVEPRWPSS